MATDISERFGIGSEQNKVVGPDLASAATIAPTHGTHLVTGTTAIVNITPPYPTFAGTIVLLAAAIWTWTAAGNIAIAGTVTAAGRSIAFTYNPATAKWYPSAVA
jgi:hypothetical protein